MTTPVAGPGGNESPALTDALIDQFTLRLTGVGGQVHRVAGSREASRIVVDIAGRGADRTVWVSDDIRQLAVELVQAIRDAGLEPRVPGSPSEVRDQPLGLGIAVAAIAETGSVIMSEPTVPNRAVTLMTETLAIVCETSTLLPSLDEAVPVLREIGASGASYATFITGPSRTADIERQLTVGVQGPGVYHVILVDHLT